MASWG